MRSLSLRQMTPRLVGFRQRLRSAAIAIALLAGALLCAPPSLLHFVLVQHFVCAEHGELVDGSDPHASEPQKSRAPQNEAKGPALRATAVSHDHEHCSLSAAAREGLALVAPASGVRIALPSLGDDLGHALCADGECAREIFRVAPKTSPPV